MKKICKILALFILIFSISEDSFSQIPRYLNYQGLAMEEDGTPIDRNITISFSIFDSENGGIELWTEIKNIDVQGGYFNTYLGTVVPLTLSFDEQYWLEVAISGENPFPRTRLSSTPYSINSLKADTSKVSRDVVDGAITQEKIQDGAITNDLIATGTIKYEKMDFATNPESNSILYFNQDSWDWLTIPETTKKFVLQYNGKDRIQWSDQWESENVKASKIESVKAIIDSLEGKDGKFKTITADEIEATSADIDGGTITDAEVSDSQLENCSFNGGSISNSTFSNSTFTGSSEFEDSSTNSVLLATNTGTGPAFTATAGSDGLAIRTFGNIEMNSALLASSGNIVIGDDALGTGIDGALFGTLGSGAETIIGIDGNVTIGNNLIVNGDIQGNISGNIVAGQSSFIDNIASPDAVVDFQNQGSGPAIIARAGSDGLAIVTYGNIEMNSELIASGGNIRVGDDVLGAGIDGALFGTTSINAVNGNINVGNNITAQQYFGDGSNLTGVAAASVNFSGVQTGTNTNQLTIGNGGQLTATGTGTIKANSYDQNFDLTAALIIALDGFSGDLFGDVQGSLTAGTISVNATTNNISGINTISAVTGEFTNLTLGSNNVLTDQSVTNVAGDVRGTFSDGLFAYSVRQEAGNSIIDATNSTTGLKFDGDLIPIDGFSIILNEGDELEVGTIGSANFDLSDNYDWTGLHTFTNNSSTASATFTNTGAGVAIYADGGTNGIAIETMGDIKMNSKLIASTNNILIGDDVLGTGVDGAVFGELGSGSETKIGIDGNVTVGNNLIVNGIISSGSEEVLTVNSEPNEGDVSGSFSSGLLVGSVQESAGSSIVDAVNTTFDLLFNGDLIPIDGSSIILNEGDELEVGTIGSSNFDLSDNYDWTGLHTFTNNSSTASATFTNTGAGVAIYADGGTNGIAIETMGDIKMNRKLIASTNNILIGDDVLGTGVDGAVFGELGLGSETKIGIDGNVTVGNNLIVNGIISSGSEEVLTVNSEPNEGDVTGSFSAGFDVISVSDFAGSSIIGAVNTTSGLYFNGSLIPIDESTIILYEGDQLGVGTIGSANFDLSDNYDWTGLHTFTNNSSTASATFTNTGAGVAIYADGGTNGIAIETMGDIKLNSKLIASTNNILIGDDVLGTGVDGAVFGELGSGSETKIGIDGNVTVGYNLIVNGIISSGSEEVLTVNSEPNEGDVTGSFSAGFDVISVRDFAGLSIIGAVNTTSGLYFNGSLIPIDESTIILNEGDQLGVGTIGSANFDLSDNYDWTGLHTFTNNSSIASATFTNTGAGVAIYADGGTNGIAIETMGDIKLNSKLIASSNTILIGDDALGAGLNGAYFGTGGNDFVSIDDAGNAVIGGDLQVNGQLLYGGSEVLTVDSSPYEFGDVSGDFGTGLLVERVQESAGYSILNALNSVEEGQFYGGLVPIDNVTIVLNDNLELEVASASLDISADYDWTGLHTFSYNTTNASASFTNTGSGEAIYADGGTDGVAIVSYGDIVMNSTLRASNGDILIGDGALGEGGGGALFGSGQDFVAIDNSGNIYVAGNLDVSGQIFNDGSALLSEDSNPSEGDVSGSFSSGLIVESVQESAGNSILDAVNAVQEGQINGNLIPIDGNTIVLDETDALTIGTIDASNIDQTADYDWTGLHTFTYNTTNASASFSNTGSGEAIYADGGSNGVAIVTYGDVVMNSALRASGGSIIIGDEALGEGDNGAFFGTGNDYVEIDDNGNILVSGFLDVAGYITIGESDVLTEDSSPVDGDITGDFSTGLLVQSVQESAGNSILDALNAVQEGQINGNLIPIDGNTIVLDETDALTIGTIDASNIDQTADFDWTGMHTFSNSATNASASFSNTGSGEAISAYAGSGGVAIVTYGDIEMNSALKAAGGSIMIGDGVASGFDGAVFGDLQIRSGTQEIRGIDTLTAVGAYVEFIHADSAMFEKGIQIGYSTQPFEGMMRYNQFTNNFEGYNGIDWFEFIPQQAIGIATWSINEDEDIYNDWSNVGIGTEFPQEQLHVDGNVLITNGTLFLGDEGGGVDIDGYQSNMIINEITSYGSSTFTGQDFDGVGLYVSNDAKFESEVVVDQILTVLGNTEASYHFEVYGNTLLDNDVRINGDMTSYGNLYLGNGCLVLDYYADSVYISNLFTVKGNTSLGDDSLVVKDGKVGIKAVDPGYNLQVGENGDGTTTAANYWGTFSDRRWKKDFEVLSDALLKLDQINGYYYYWKDRPDKSRQLGVIAQEIEVVIPELVKTNPDGYKTVDYSKLTALLIQAVKEQQKLINDQQSRLVAVEVQNKNLSSANSNYEKRLMDIEKKISRLERLTAQSVSSK